MNARALWWLVPGTLIAVVACARQDTEGWRTLFDGESLSGWHGYNGASLEAWTVEGGAIKAVGTEGNYGSDMRADFVTHDEFTNFDLSLEWKATEGGNSGIMYGVIEDERYDAAWKTGPEYQLVHDVGFPEPLEEWQEAAANYAMHSAAPDKPLNEVGEWNSSRIVVNGDQVEHWLNGVKVLEFRRWTAEWNSLKNAGKWLDAPDYGSAATGHIVIQDHGSVFWFRNVRIRELDGE